MALAACAPAGARSASSLAGEWRETFEMRSGCSDQTALAVEGAAVSVSGQDCEGKLAYRYSNVVYDGKRLAFDLDVPAKGHHLRYHLRWLTEDDLAGDADVTAAGTTKTFDVRWTRVKKP
jgi:hypothetical protein